MNCSFTSYLDVVFQPGDKTRYMTFTEIVLRFCW